jgi:hypothetical protein
MSIVLKAEMISRALFEFDPMSTGCKEYNCFHEYDQLAESVEGRLRQGFNLKEALVLELSESFFDADALHINCLTPVVRHLEGRGE